MVEKGFMSVEDIAMAFDRIVVTGKESVVGKRELLARQEKLFAEGLILPPAKIYEVLEKTVLGQEEAKKSLSVILYQHLKRYAFRGKEKQPPKTNALLIGPSGCGKTMLAGALAAAGQVPFLKVDATNFAQRGYRGGMHAEQIVDLLMTAAKGTRHKPGWGIVFIDEVDKIRNRCGSDDDLAGSGIQQDLLSIIDGGEVYYEPDHSEYGREKFNFRNVLFIFGGSFGRLAEKEEITIKELTRYGFIPEFANRLGNIIRLEPLPDEVIRKLIRKEVGEYNSYIPMTEAEAGVYAEIIHSIVVASKAHESMGGRCVGPLVRRFFEDRIFEIGQEGKSEL
jgi:ATP-dependent Clp protease ATP-binding subunit ClpX